MISQMNDSVFVQIVVSRLKPTAERNDVVELHRQTVEWMSAHSDCVSYEVFEGRDGTIADRIVWRSQEGAMRGNEEYARTLVAAGMQRVVATYQNFFGTPIKLALVDSKGA